MDGHQMTWAAARLGVDLVGVDAEDLLRLDDRRSGKLKVLADVASGYSPDREIDRRLTRIVICGAIIVRCS